MLTVVADPGSVADSIAALVDRQCADTLTMAAALVDAMPPGRAAPLDALGDADLEAGLIQPLASLGATLAGLVPQHRRIVLIGTMAGFGQWHASLSAGFAAGATGLMRSVALEFMREGVTVNMIALGDMDDRQAVRAAGLAAVLLQSDAMSGQVLPCDGGDNLRMTQARNRPLA
ncbi:hypothetical protein [Blastomonas sp. AAP53]|uniref:hypothetical protein n=1 Tax=Blastomonas sp. AAP53 TaxID=1248760 RepID=UPI0002ED275E|nr:hypothetical protein [Blastomonas sp. AAP53]